MAHIVQFHGGPARVVTEPEAAGDGNAHSRGAQIIIFPGVRRERHAEPEEGPDVSEPSTVRELDLHAPGAGALP